MDEREVLLAWRSLFRTTDEPTPETLGQATTLLGSLNTKSSLYGRLTKELDSFTTSPRSIEPVSPAPTQPAPQLKIYAEESP